MKMRARAVALMFVASFAAGPSLAQVTEEAPAAAPQRPLTVHDLDEFRAELRSSKKQAIAANLTLTDAEATRFWPVYHRYAAEVTTIKNDQYAIIADYINRFGKYDDKAASDFIARWLALDVRTTALRARYVPIVGKALPGLKAATFFQIDRRLQMLVDLSIASRLAVLQLQAAR